MRRLIILTAGLAAAGLAAWKLKVEPWYRDWGHDPDEVAKSLPGDDLVGDPSVIDTRGIDIAAPPERVWPWLVQMGYGRGGWYSYDQMDMKGRSAETILPEFQSLVPGDILPVAPGAGFRAEVVDPGHALVLYLDGELAKAQAEAARAAGVEEASADLKAADRAMGANFPSDFAVSWALVVEPRGVAGSRLIERMRLRMGEAPQAAKAAVPFFGLGVFAMMRKQMLGIQERAERGEERGPEASPEPIPA